MREIIAKQIAQEMNLPYETVMEIIKDQMYFIKETMEQGDDRGIRLPFLGKFVVKPRRKQYLEHSTAQKRLREKKIEYEVFMDGLVEKAKYITNIPDWILVTAKVEKIKIEWDQLNDNIEMESYKSDKFDVKYKETEFKFYELKQKFFKELNQKL